MKLIKIAAAFLCLLLTSCEGYEIFEKELYEKIVYVLAENDEFYEVHSLDSLVSTGRVVVAVSGTEPVTELVTVEFEYDAETVEEYRKKEGATTPNVYMDLTNPHIEIPSMITTIDPADNPPRGFLTINVKPEGLSPDSTYYVPLKIKSSSLDSISVENDHVMYRIYIKNRFADQEESTRYSASVTFDESMPYVLDKTVLPLSKDEIRTTVGTETFEATIASIATRCMVIKIKADNSLVLSAYDPDYMELEMFDDEEYNNQYRRDVAGESRFYYAYRYRVRTTPDEEWGEWKTVRENMLRFKKEELE